MFSTEFGIKAVAYRDIVLVTRSGKPAMVFRGSSFIRSLDVIIRKSAGENRSSLKDRWIRKDRVGVYLIDNQDILYLFKWSDIDENNLKNKIQIETNVENFYVSHKRITVLQKTGKLIIPSKLLLKLSTVKENAKWSTVVHTESHWIVSGDLDGQAIIASITRALKPQIPLTPSIDPSTPFHRCNTIFSLTPISTSRKATVLLPIEQSGGCHLI